MNFQLRPFQKQALEALKTPKHLICVAPTGSGKSLIYEKFSMNPGTRTVLVTPLVALARQQAARLSAAGGRVFLTAGNSGAPVPNRETGSGSWILSPESIPSDSCQRALRRWKPNFLVVDECHCLWDWGGDFRPAFSELPPLIERYGIRRSLWLTATLPLDAREDLRSRLPDPIQEIGRFSLPTSLELSVRRVPWPERVDALLTWVLSQNGAGIVFVPTREGTARVARLLTEAGLRAIAYHAGMSKEERQALEGSILRGEIDVVVATSAFGMGMDFLHLRWVVLYQAPPSLLMLAQTIGRVGRANQIGKALVLWDREDFRLLEWMLRGAERRKRDLLGTLKYLETPQCRRLGLERFFEEDLGGADWAPCGLCDFCIIALDAGVRAGVSADSPSIQSPRTIRPDGSVWKQVLKFFATGTMGS